MTHNKTVFDNDMTAHVWASQSQNHGRNSNNTFSFHGPLIKSYAAEIGLFYTPKKRGSVQHVFINDHNYSVTTARHIGLIYGATSHIPSFYVGAELIRALHRFDGVENERELIADEVTTQCRRYIASAWDSVKRAENAYKNWPYLLDDAAHDAGHAKKLADLFGVRFTVPATLMRAIRVDNRKALEPILAQQFKAERAQRAKIERKAREERRLREERNAMREARFAVQRIRVDEPRGRVENIDLSHAADYYDILQLPRLAPSLRSALERAKAKHLSTYRPVWNALIEKNARRELHRKFKRLQGLTVSEDVLIEHFQYPTLMHIYPTREQELIERIGGNAKVDGFKSATLRKWVENERALRGHAVAVYKRRRFEAQAAERKAELNEFYDWLNGDNHRCPRVYMTDADGNVFLRKHGDHLQTSKGASVPWSHAVRVFKFLKHVRNKGVEWKRNGQQIRVGHFSVDRINSDGSFTAQCHNFAWPEIERLASSEGVFDVEAADLFSKAGVQSC